MKWSTTVGFGRWLFLAYLCAQLAPGIRASARPDYYAEDANRLASVGAMSKANFARLDHIDTIIEQRQFIANKDLDWCIKLLETDPPANTQEAREELTTTVVFRLLLLHKYTKAQTLQMNKAATWLAHTHLWGNKLWAVNIFGHTRDTAALPIVEGFVTDPNPILAARAKLFVDRAKAVK